MNEITAEQLYDWQFKNILDEIFRETMLSYVKVLVLFQITDDVVTNFTKNSAELKQIDLFLHYFAKIIDKHNLIIKDLRKMNMKLKI